jgi:uncharacterized protein (DUF4415 family)
MQQNKENNMEDDKRFLETAKRVIKQNPEMFEALMEFERTKKLPKLTRKERINLTIDSRLLRKFREYCRIHSKTMSKVIERHIREELGMKN